MLVFVPAPGVCMTDAAIDGHVVTPTTGLDVHVRDWGGPPVRDGGQRPVVLLHGLASTCHIPDLSGVTFDGLLERTRGSLGFLDETFRRSYFGANMQVGPDGSIRARLPRDKHMRILRTLWDEDVEAAFGALRRPALALLAERT